MQHGLLSDYSRTRVVYVPLWYFCVIWLINQSPEAWLEVFLFVISVTFKTFQSVLKIYGAGLKFYTRYPWNGAIHPWFYPWNGAIHGTSQYLVQLYFGNVKYLFLLCNATSVCITSKLFASYIAYYICALVSFYNLVFMYERNKRSFWNFFEKSWSI